MSHRVFKHWRITISSGVGENRLRQAVLVVEGDPEQEYPSLDLLKNALTALQRWVNDYPPARERKDWVVMQPIESLMHWPDDCETCGTDKSDGD